MRRRKCLPHRSRAGCVVVRGGAVGRGEAADVSVAELGDDRDHRVGAAGSCEVLEAGVAEGVDQAGAVEVTVASLAAGLGDEEACVAGGAVDRAVRGVGFVVGAQRVRAAEPSAFDGSLEDRSELRLLGRGSRAHRGFLLRRVRTCRAGCLPSVRAPRRGDGCRSVR